MGTRSVSRGGLIFHVNYDQATAKALWEGGEHF
jgi:hypothetical protein